MTSTGVALAGAGMTGPRSAALPLPQPSSEHAAYFDVRSFGAVGNGTVIDSTAVNRAIDAAAASDGGVVRFGPGTYKCYSIRLKSNITLLIENGATVEAAETTDPQLSYDPAEPNPVPDGYVNFGHLHWHNSLIWGEGLHDIAIIGGGVIFGKGLSRGGRNDLPNAENPGVGNKTIGLKNCHNVLLRDFSILGGGHFGVLATGVDNLTIDNLKIDTVRDGMDIDCCRNVRISNCSVNSPWDDAICLKSSLALGELRMTDNVTISNCYVSGCYELGSMLNGTFKKFPEDATLPRQGGIKCGTESNGGFRNIAISNCVFEGCRGLSLESVDGALTEDISIFGLTMRDIQAAPLFLRLGSRMRGPTGASVGGLRRILINNVVCSNANQQFATIVSGIPGHVIRDLQFSNIFIQHQGVAGLPQPSVKAPEFERKRPDSNMFGPLPASGFFLRHLSNLDMSHIEIEAIRPDSRATFYLNDVDRAFFFRIRSHRTSATPLFLLDQVRKFDVCFSERIPDTTLDLADHVTL